MEPNTEKKTKPANKTAEAGKAEAIGDSANEKAAEAHGSGIQLQVTAKIDGFRRAGRAWHGTSVVDADELSEEQITQLKEERNLAVTEVAQMTRVAD